MPDIKTALWVVRFRPQSTGTRIDVAALQQSLVTMVTTRGGRSE